MATSSIFKNFKIRGRDEVENFVKMLDSEPMPIPEANARFVTDPDEIKDLLRSAVAGMKKTMAEAEKSKEENITKNGNQ